mgnify:CR=1 FL=1|tara:strand:+ start:444 stop:599 length:156 start_codon:yes stop_codon:yes gene_type:complete
MKKKKKDERYERLLIMLNMGKDKLKLATHDKFKKACENNIKEIQQVLNQYK